VSADPRVAAIRRLEDIGFATWPAFERARHDGWELRVAKGVTRRANSVNPIEPSGLPLDEKISHAETWFEARGGSAVFRLTELAEPGLEANLELRRYRAGSPTDVMVTAATPRPETAVDIEPDLTDAWFRAFCAWNGRDPRHAGALHRLIASIPGERAFASVTVDGASAAVGLGVVLDGHVGIYNMNTDPSRRRKGLAAAILDALIDFGASRGAEVAFLQVLCDNDPAQALYRRAGFEPLYRYWYREPAPGEHTPSR
jgi:ribosomal protein S18 acetylase RimI-like enzyme